MKRRRVDRVDAAQLEVVLRSVRTVQERHGAASWVPIGEAYAEYSRTPLPEPLAHMTQRHFYTGVVVLEADGVVERRVVSRGRGGRMSVIRRVMA